MQIKGLDPAQLFYGYKNFQVEHNFFAPPSLQHELPTEMQSMGYRGSAFGAVILPHMEISQWVYWAFILQHREISNFKCYFRYFRITVLLSLSIYYFPYIPQQRNSKNIPDIPKFKTYSSLMLCLKLWILTTYYRSITCVYLTLGIPRLQLYLIHRSLEVTAETLRLESKLFHSSRHGIQKMAVSLSHHFILIVQRHLIQLGHH